jgi:ferredoxin-NADP reductase
MGSFLFPQDATEERFLFIAGGTGIAPIRAMIRQALMTGRRGPMKLLYSAKTADDFAYLSELEGMASRNELDLRLHVTRPPDASTDLRAGSLIGLRAGRIGLAEIAPLIDNPATLCFVCGPETMVAAIPRMLLDLGIERGRIRIEEF